MCTKYSISKTVFVIKKKSVIFSLHKFITKEISMIKQIKMPSLSLCFGNRHLSIHEIIRYNKPIHYALHLPFFVYVLCSKYQNIVLKQLTSFTNWLHFSNSFEWLNWNIFLFLNNKNDTLRKMRFSYSPWRPTIQKVIKRIFILILPIVIYRLNTKPICESYIFSKYPARTNAYNVYNWYNKNYNQIKQIVYRLPENWINENKLLAKKKDILNIFLNQKDIQPYRTQQTTLLKNISRTLVSQDNLKTQNVKYNLILNSLQKNSSFKSYYSWNINLQEIAMAFLNNNTKLSYYSLLNMDYINKSYTDLYVYDQCNNDACNNLIIKNSLFNIKNFRSDSILDIFRNNNKLLYLKYLQNNLSDNNNDRFIINHQLDLVAYQENDKLLQLQNTKSQTNLSQYSSLFLKFVNTNFANNNFLSIIKNKENKTFFDNLVYPFGICFKQDSNEFYFLAICQDVQHQLKKWYINVNRFNIFQQYTVWNFYLQSSILFEKNRVFWRQNLKTKLLHREHILFQQNIHNKHTITYYIHNWCLFISEKLVLLYTDKQNTMSLYFVYKLHKHFWPSLEYMFFSVFINSSINNYKNVGNLIKKPLFLDSLSFILNLPYVNQVVYQKKELHTPIYQEQYNFLFSITKSSSNFHKSEIFDYQSRFLQIHNSLYKLNNNVITKNTILKVDKHIAFIYNIILSIQNHFSTNSITCNSKKSFAHKINLAKEQSVIITILNTIKSIDKNIIFFLKKNKEYKKSLTIWNCGFLPLNHTILSVFYSEIISKKIQNQLYLINHKMNKIHEICILDHQRILIFYQEWIFTSQWWFLVQKAFIQITRIFWKRFGDIIYWLMLDFCKKLDVLNSRICVILFPKFFKNTDFAFLKDICKIDGFLWQQIYTKNYNWKNVGHNLELFQNCKTNELVQFGWLIIYFAIYWHLISTCLGFAHIFLWTNFEKNRCLFDPSWNTQIDIVVYNSFSSLLEKTRCEAYSSYNKIMVIRNILFSQWIGKLVLNKWLSNATTLDVFREEKVFFVNQFLISKKRLVNFAFHKNIVHKLSFFDSNCLNNKLYLFHNISHNFLNKIFFNPNKVFCSRFIFYTFYSANLANSEKLLSNNKQIQQLNWKSNFENAIVTLEPEYLPPRGLLLIGPKETSKFYVTKTLAANANMAVILISISKLLSVDLPLQNEIEEDLFETPIKGHLNRLLFMLDLATILAPCIVWIPSIDKLCFNDIVESTTSDTSFMFKSLLKTMSSNLYADLKRGIIFIGSADNMEELDPSLVSTYRFHKLINVRSFSNIQRHQKLITLLTTNKVNLRQKLWSLEINNSTMGYTHIDLNYLMNEAILICTTQTQKKLTTSAIDLALYRQKFGIENGTVLPYNDVLFSKIGNKLIHNILSDSNSLLTIQITQGFWKTRFYHLSKAYIEPSTLQSSITEFAVFHYICKNLFGCAARDALLFSINRVQSYVLSLNKQVRDNLKIALSLFEALFSNLTFSDMLLTQNKRLFAISSLNKIYYSKICHKIKSRIEQRHNQFYKEQNLPNDNPFLTNNTGNILSYNSQQNIYWSDLKNRFDLYRNNLIHNQTVSQNNFYVSPFLFYNQVNPFLAQHHTFIYAPYERAVTQSGNNIDRFKSGINFQFFEKQEETPDFLNESTQIIEYKAFYNPRLFMSGRFVWNPEFLFISKYFLLNRKYINITQNILSMLMKINSAQKRNNKVKQFKKNIQLSSYRQTDHFSNISNSDTNVSKIIKKQYFEQMNVQHFDLYKQIVKISSSINGPQLLLTNYIYQNLTNYNANYVSFYNYSIIYNYEKQTQKNMIYVDTTKELYNIIFETYYYLVKLCITNTLLLS